MSLAGGDLTTLTTLQGYIGSSGASAAVLSGLISRISRLTQSCLNRSLLVPKDYVQRFNGTGTRSLVLPNWPILELASVVISGASIDLISDDNTVYSSYGIRFQPWDGLPPGDPAVLEYSGGFYLFGGQNVVVSYRAGYQITAEAQTIPSTPFKITPVAPYGQWATDEGVTYDDGVALTAISSGAPLAGQYLPPAPDLASPRPDYLFAAADTGRGVLLTYGFVPFDVEQAVLEFIIERSAYRNRPGVRSQMLASQETIVYEMAGLSKFVDNVLGNYKSILPPSIGANV